MSLHGQSHCGFMEKLKRLGGYLQGQPRSTTMYTWQGSEEQILGYCRVTAKSTSEGVVMIWPHFIKEWARAQNHVTLSSAEAELIALVKCAQECMGTQSMLRDWGVEALTALYVDSSAALAIAKL